MKDVLSVRCMHMFRQERRWCTFQIKSSCNGPLHPLHRACDACCQDCDEKQGPHLHVREASQIVHRHNPYSVTPAPSVAHTPADVACAMEMLQALPVLLHKP